jgi:hypothetical protein
VGAALLAVVAEPALALVLLLLLQAAANSAIDSRAARLA